MTLERTRCKGGGREELMKCVFLHPFGITEINRFQLSSETNVAESGIQSTDLSHFRGRAPCLVSLSQARLCEICDKFALTKSCKYVTFCFNIVFPSV